MTIVRVKRVKRYRSKGRWYAYHRLTGKRLHCEFGSGAFFAELAVLEGRVQNRESLPGSLGLLLASYRGSPTYLDLALASRESYGRMMNVLAPLHDMPLLQLTPQFVAGLRDRLASTRGRRHANLTLAVLSVACEHGKEHGMLQHNPVKGIKRIRRPRGAAPANRPWSEAERRAVLEHVPWQIRVPVALAMFTGLRKGDVLALTKNAVGDGRIWRRTNKTGQQIAVPLHPDLARILAAAPHHAAVTIAATSMGTPWTGSGFNSSFNKAIGKLKAQGVVGDGLTFHGLRHTVGTLLVEAGCDLDTVRRWLGQKTLAMAIHYSATADISVRLADLMENFDPLGSKKGTEVSNRGKRNV